jgi:ATP-binding cassette subfamily B protein/subfamily B ATP-binding cassette protein MsbA
MDAQLTLMAALVAPGLLGVMRGFSGAMVSRATNARQAESQMTSQVTQVMSAIPLVRAFAREAHEERQFATCSDIAVAARLSQHGVEVIYWFLIAVVLGMATTGVTWLGALKVLHGQLSVGGLMVFLAYLGMLFGPLQTLSNVVGAMQDASAGAKRVIEILDLPEEVQENHNGFHVGSNGCFTGDVEFRDVAFSYDPGREVLRRINLRMQRGKRVALIGPSGVGKTSLLQLLPRFYDPTAGAIMLDGHDMKTIPLRSLRSNVSVVLQDALLMPVTVAENIAYGKLNATRSEIIAAAHAANAASFIERLPHGYDTVIGERGAWLSVGERQRLSIARAFLKDAPILAMDEPTSAQDSESESAIVDALEHLMKNRAVLIVGHRLTTVRTSNLIVVLQEGSVTEAGSHEELLRLNGYYAGLIKKL